MIKYLLTVVIIAFLIIVYIILQRPETVVLPVAVETPAVVPVQIAFTNYLCDDNIPLSATYYDMPTVPEANADATAALTGSVTINLPGQRTVSLKETLAASGVRYISPDESIEFWNKGREVLFSEKSVTPDVYTHCIEIAAETPEPTTVYHNGTIGFTLRYGIGYLVDEAYTYQLKGPGKGIPGIKFSVPVALATGTNLSPDSYISIETLKLGSDGTCQAEEFLSEAASSTEVVLSNNVTYSVATSTGAAAGNRYEESVFALPSSNKCLAVRYEIHYGVLENYASGTVKAFDKTFLMASFDAIRESLIYN